VLWVRLLSFEGPPCFLRRLSLCPCFVLGSRVLGSSPVVAPGSALRLVPT